MKYSSQIVIKKLDNKFIFNNKNDDNNLPQLIIEGKLDTSAKVNVEWINDNKWVKKHYQRKGMMQIFNDLYLYSSIKRTRSFREFEILNYLVISDFSTCKPLIGWVEYIGEILYRANLITENIPGMNYFRSGGYGTISGIQLRGLPKRYSTVFVFFKSVS